MCLPESRASTESVASAAAGNASNGVTAIPRPQKARQDWYRLGAWRLTGDGRCVSCDTPLAGVFDGPPGTWGPRRLPVQITNQ